MQFYQAYPDAGIDQQFLLQRGFFQYLQQYCGLAFERGKNHALLSNSEEGILHWDDTTLSHLKAKMKRSLEEAQLDMVSNLFKFVSGLCLGKPIMCRNHLGSKVLQVHLFDFIQHYILYFTHANKHSSTVVDLESIHY